jgi:hypothetical protein
MPIKAVRSVKFPALIKTTGAITVAKTGSEYTFDFDPLQCIPYDLADEVAYAAGIECNHAPKATVVRYNDFLYVFSAEDGYITTPVFDSSKWTVIAAPSAFTEVLRAEEAADAAEASALQASTSATSAQTSATNAANSASAAGTSASLASGVAVGNSYVKIARCATTGNISLSGIPSSTLTDNVTVVGGDPVVVVAQTLGQQNGLYTVNAGGAWTRHASFDTSGEAQGAIIHVLAGTRFSGKIFRLITENITLGTTPLVFVDDSTLTVKPGATGNAIDIYAGGTGYGLAGANRMQFDQFGAFYTQAWGVISGKYNLLNPTTIKIISAGGSPNYPGNLSANGLGAFTSGMLQITNDIAGPNIVMQDNGNTLGYSPVDASIVSGGTSGYVVGDVLTAVGGTVVAQTTALFGGINNETPQGTGYAVSEVITVQGTSDLGIPVTRATVQVTSVDGSGRITGATLLSAGSYTKYPSSVVTQFSTTGSGSGAYFLIYWPSRGPTRLRVTSVDGGGVITGIEIADPGLYFPQPSNPVSVTGGSGSGSPTFNFTYGGPQGGNMGSAQMWMMDSTNALRRVDEADGSIRFGQAWRVEDFYNRNVTNLKRIDSATVGTDAGFRVAGTLSVVGDVDFGTLRRYSGFTRSIVATVGNTVEIGKILSASRTIELSIQTSGTGWNVAKTYLFPVKYGAFSWKQLVPVYDTGASNSYDFAVDIQTDVSGNIFLRIRTVSINVAAINGTAHISMLSHGPAVSAPNEVFTPTSSTNSGVSAPTTFYTPVAPDVTVINSAQRFTPTTGTTVSVANGAPLCIVAPAGTLAALTVTLPSYLDVVPGQIQRVSFTQTITALTVNGASATPVFGAPTTIAASNALQFVYLASPFGWHLA